MLILGGYHLETSKRTWKTGKLFNANSKIIELMHYCFSVALQKRTIIHLFGAWLYYPWNNMFWLKPNFGVSQVVSRLLWLLASTVDFAKVHWDPHPEMGTQAGGSHSGVPELLLDLWKLLTEMAWTIGSTVDLTLEAKFYQMFVGGNNFRQLHNAYFANKHEA